MNQAKTKLAKSEKAYETNPGPQTTCCSPSGTQGAAKRRRRLWRERGERSQTWSFYRYGSRVPCIVVGPYAKPEHVSNDLLSHVSLVAFIERLWNLPASPNQDAARRTAAGLAMADRYDLTSRL